METQPIAFQGTFRGKTYVELRERTGRWQVFFSKLMGYLLIAFGLAIAWGWLSHLSLYPDTSLRLLLVVLNLIIFIMGVGFIVIAKWIARMAWMVMGPTQKRWAKMSAKYP
jgi:hypothetical protein